MKDDARHAMILASNLDTLPPLYRLLTDVGYYVATYSSPWGACEYAANEKPTAILTELGFPGCDGLEIVRLLRIAAPGSRIIVLAPAHLDFELGQVTDAGGGVLLSSPAGDRDILRRLHAEPEGLPTRSQRSNPNHRVEESRASASAR